MSDGSFPLPLVFAQPPLVVVTKTLHLKVHPDAYPWLDQAGREVNQVWNWANATSREAIRGPRASPQWLSAYELDALAAGVGELFKKIGIDVVQCVNQEYVTRRNQFHKAVLNFRKSGGSRKSLGWVPFKAPNLKLKEKLREELPKLTARRKKETDEAWDVRVAKHEAEVKRIESLPKKQSVQLMGKTIRLFEIEKLFALRKAGGRLRAGNFAQNSLGEWFLNVTVDEYKVQLVALEGNMSSCGLDPGLKTTLTAQDGQTWDIGKFYREAEEKIAELQSCGHKQQAKHVHQKVKNQRADARNKAVKELTDRYQHIFIGNASCALVNRGNMAKAGYDNAWGALRACLKSVGHRAGRHVELVDEKYTTQDCSSCWARSGPAGLDNLVVRTWTCHGCGTVHDRDTCSAQNIDQKGWIVFQARAKAVASVCGNERA